MFDEEKAREVLRKHTDLAKQEWWREQVLDALAGCVTDDPPTIDPGDLHSVCVSISAGSRTASQGEAEIFALLRPDPRIAKLEAAVDRLTGIVDQATLYDFANEVRAILRGEA